MQEDEDQIALFRWVEIYSEVVPELKWLYHCPNGGDRDIRVAVRLKLMGVRAGVADLMLPVARRRPLADYPGPDRSGWYHGFYGELKRSGGDRPTGKQMEFLRDMRAAGYYVTWERGYVAMWHAIEDYLGIDMPFSLIPDPRPRVGELALPRPPGPL
jgi:hypothetical protein